MSGSSTAGGSAQSQPRPARDGPAGARLARWLFLRALAVIFLIAFVSLWLQIDGLIGSRGILPAERFLDDVRRQLGPEAWWRAPTLCWLGAGDAMLHGLCAAGSLLALLLLADVAPAFCAFGLWALYLSLVTVGQDFLSFQWDNLLLEAGWLAVFLSPLRIGPRPPAGDAPPPRLALWLARWLLVRLMVASAIVKLASGDAVWYDLTALTYHYETQPLPPWTAWYAHHLPVWAHRALCLMVFIVEGLVPWLVFGPRRCRQAACVILAGFQLMIIATGNYGFFNWLTIALCLLTLDDRDWPSRARAVLDRTAGPPRGRAWPWWALAPLAGIVLVMTSMQMLGSFRLGLRWPEPMMALYRAAAPWRSINPYGLFAVMTTKRPEIVLEGSRDGRSWSAYEFRDKPGDVRRRPRFVAPHQPRLDWQMWFAALGTYQDNPWLLAFCQRLLEGSPEVSRLLAVDPFANSPPRYIRAALYDYRFSDPATRRREGAWWRREARGLYCPALSLRREP